MVLLSARPDHLKRYKDIAQLLVKYARPSMVPDGGLIDGLGGGPVTDPGTAPEDAKKLACDLEELGPTFIKLGQLLSTRADLLPPAHLEALSRLQDDVEPIAYEVVAGIIEAELGARVSNLFSEFDEKPVASASLGQVHRAAMRDGRPVAVKVQRPDIRERINTDLEAIAQIAGMADRHFEVGRRFGFSGMVAEFRRSMLRELDYRVEARNLELLGQNLAQFDRIMVPQPVKDYTTAKVLTMEFVGGRKITSVGALGRLELDGRALAEQLFAAYLKQVLIDGFFHADPHPGNVYITDDDRLALLDLGMVARVTPSMQEHLVKLLVAVGDGNGERAAEAAQALGERRDDIDFDEDLFRRRVIEVVAEQSGTSMAEMSAGRVVAELSRIAGESGLRPSSELTMLGKALLNLDEVARALDPDFQPDQAIRREAGELLRDRTLRSLSPSNMLATAMEAKEFAERMPSRVNKVMEALAEGRLTLKVEGIDERELMGTLGRMANRITMGLVLAALIIGAAMLMRIETSSRLLGYPTLAIVSFLLAAGGALALLVSILLGDRRRQ